MFASDVEIKVF